MINETLIFKKQGSNLVPISQLELKKLSLFTSKLNEGDEVEVYFQKKDDPNGSLGQLSKIHVMIRQLANDTGNNEKDIKELVKQKAGLYFPASENDLKSFANCSKEELNRAIIECEKIGAIVGSNIY